MGFVIVSLAMAVVGLAMGCVGGLIWRGDRPVGVPAVLVAVGIPVVARGPTSHVIVLKRSHETGEPAGPDAMVHGVNPHL